MRVKRHKPEDLADALKQLKLTDRRSRLSLRGRATNSFGFLSSSTIDGNLRCRLTHSVSSTTSSSHNPRGAEGGDGGLYTSCVCECCTVASRTRAYVATADYAPYRQSLDSSLHLGTDSPPARFVHRTGLPASSSGFSPFTTSAGLLYSTLPTNFDFSCTGAINDVLDQQRAYHSSKLRRSYGAGLSSIDVEPSTQPPSTSRGSFGSVLTTSSDKHHCCPHHNLHSTQSSNQMRLYRRLYSLIDILLSAYINPAALQPVHILSRPLAVSRPLIGIRCPYGIGIQ
ncbi:hypothetical protein CRM22_000963 [Opisthorchis felineus]|uniref:Uncharacterized protein n=1 Tax=Opisthorchis felineus TaxID=147828 RepID=A0A4S2MCQ8_OPIFE|nr:hypothetical protein CRM22_000963 [Opisthorchis felineus]